MILTFIYWGMLIVMGPVTIFLFAAPVSGVPMLVGIIIFWVSVIIAVILSFITKGQNTDAGAWYRDVFLYGAYELAKEIANRHSEYRNFKKEDGPDASPEKKEEEANPWWFHVFVFWWGFSVKYFIPFALWFLMMWNFKSDVTLNASTGRSYGSYHIFWQCMGFVFPAIGLALFIIPIFVFWGKK